MQSTESLTTPYTNLLKACYQSRDQYGEADLILGTLGVGESYDHELLVVGRADNGGKYDFLKDKWGDYTNLIDKCLPRIGTETLEWVDDLAGPNDKYNTNKSAYWRMVRLLARKIVSDTDDCLSYIAVSNLYKVTNGNGGNPSEPLCDLQFQSCVDILRTEIAILKPKVVVFLTGQQGWAGPFLDCLGIQNQSETKGREFVQFFAKVDGTKYIVGQHPQARPEQEHLTEILTVLSNLG